MQTRTDATLSPFVIGWLRDLRGFWVVEDAAGIREVQTGELVTQPDDLFGLTTAVERPAESAFNHSVLTFDALLRHRAEPETRIATIVPALLSALGADEPRRWDVHEPLGRSWDVDALTSHARAGMPLCTAMYWSGDDAYGRVAAARTEDGLHERVRGGVRHTGSPATALARARAAASTLAAARAPVLTCVFSAAGTEADLRRHPGAEASQRPLAALLGPAAIGRLGTTPKRLAERHGGELVGRPRVPGVLVTFDEIELGRARQRYLDLASPTGVA